MAYFIEHKMTIDEVDFRLRVLCNILNNDYVKALEEARKYLDELRGIDNSK